MKKTRELLMHIRDECDFIINATESISFEDMVEDEILRRAIVRSLEIIGEATKNISSEFKEEYSEVPWSNIAGMRDVLIHGYYSVDYKLVWDVIENHIPNLYHTVNHGITNFKE